MSVVLVDAGGTNIGSVRYALQRLGIDAALTSNAGDIRAADKVILPGVGAAGPGMARLRELELADVIRSLTQPVLGVCLGMQLLCEHSDEGDTACLGVVPGRVSRFDDASGLCIPHMGWNRLSPVGEHPLVKNLEDGAWAYFVHSYAVSTGSYTLVASDYGGPFSAVIAHRNFHGMQFHPERSASVGAKLLKNFLEL
ncbi:MAG TPA: imidazole glycerol phosphate synthase subunit HisH [Dyella sp.]|nr:imidazole glycerol phosphate synthase subunit HisH [Dyella sp.]